MLIKISGNAMCDAIFTTGTMAFLTRMGPYFLYFCSTCPHSCAAMETAAIVFLSYTPSERLTVLLRGSKWSVMSPAMGCTVTPGMSFWRSMDCANSRPVTPLCARICEYFL